MPWQGPWRDVCPQSRETLAAPAKTQDTKAAENAAGADQAAGADTEAAASADMEVNTTDPITLRFGTGGEGIPAMKRHLKAIEAFEAKYPNITVEAEYEAF